MNDHSAAEGPEPPQQSDGEQEHQDEQSYGHKGPIRTGDCSNRYRARYKAQAIVHADMESGGRPLFFQNGSRAQKVDISHHQRSFHQGNCVIDAKAAENFLYISGMKETISFDNHLEGFSFTDAGRLYGEDLNAGSLQDRINDPLQRLKSIIHREHVVLAVSYCRKLSFIEVFHSHTVHSGAQLARSAGLSLCQVKLILPQFPVRQADDNAGCAVTISSAVVYLLAGSLKTSVHEGVSAWLHHPQLLQTGPNLLSVLC